MTKGPWSPNQVRLFVRRVREEAGNGWQWMVPRVREALIAERCLLVITGQEKEAVSVEAATWLLDAMLKEAGLRNP